MLYRLVGGTYIAAGARKKLAAVAASVSDGDTITTGLSSIDAVVVCHGASTALGSSASAFDATVRSVSGGVVTVTVVSRTDAPALAAYGTDATVYCIAVGD